jgi:putative FmdB family regulatory protein
MPLYEYKCEACGERFEVIRKFSDEPLETCRKCGKGPIHRLQSSPAIQFKGSGFYITDYAKKGSSESSGTSSTAKESKAEKSETTTATESKSTETKSETKSESTPAAKTESKPAAKDT